VTVPDPGANLRSNMSYVTPRRDLSRPAPEVMAAKAAELQDVLDTARRVFGWRTPPEIAEGLQVMAAERGFKLVEPHLSAYSAAIGAGRRVTVLV
jgi:hypothetical protein